jgi:hypothetical protein
MGKSVNADFEVDMAGFFRAVKSNVAHLLGSSNPAAQTNVSHLISRVRPQVARCYRKRVNPARQARR